MKYIILFVGVISFVTIMIEGVEQHIDNAIIAHEAQYHKENNE